MGRTLVVRVFLFVAFCAASVAPAPALAEEYVADTHASAGLLDELESWLSELCLVVQCTANRPVETESVSRTEWAAVHFVLDYEAFGVRQEVTLDELTYARTVTLKSIRLLAEHPGSLDPEIEKALNAALSSLRSELGK